jgi:hypothetical protein
MVEEPKPEPQANAPRKGIEELIEEFGRTISLDSTTPGEKTFAFSSTL